MTEQPGASGAMPHGSLSEEALKLAETLQTWLNTGAAMTGAGSASECKVCPLCQAIAVVNNMKPEVLGHLAEAGSQLMAAFKAATDKAATDGAAPTGAADAGAAGARSHADGGTTPAERSWAAADRPPVQHIQVT